MVCKVLIADDHKLFRQGLKSLIKTRSDLVEVVGEAETGREVLDLAGELNPDIILMDIYMPEGDGLQALEEVGIQYPDIKTIILTSSESDEHLFRAVQLGAVGYLLKDLDASQLFDLIEGVQRGEAAITREMAFRLLKGIAEKSANPDRGEEALSERELAVLRLVAVGKRNAEIAEALVISVNTVKTHIRSILEKLQLENRTQAANYAMTHGIVSPLSDDQTG
jgi:DNA-binding NarL/FixJ family response regulator